MRIFENTNYAEILDMTPIKNTGEKEELHVNITEEEINDIKYKKNNNRKNLIHECDAMVPCLFCLIMERPIYLHSKHNI